MRIKCGCGVFRPQDEIMECFWDYEDADVDFCTLHDTNAKLVKAADALAKAAAELRDMWFKVDPDFIGYTHLRKTLATYEKVRGIK